MSLDFVPSGNKTVKEETSCNVGILRQQEQTDIDLLQILILINIYSILIHWNVERVYCHTDSPKTYTNNLFFKKTTVTIIIATVISAIPVIGTTL